MGLESDVAKLMKRMADLEKDLEQLQKDHNTFGKWAQKEIGETDGKIRQVESQCETLRKIIAK